MPKELLFGGEKIAEL